MTAFTESAAQSYRDTRLNRHLASDDSVALDDCEITDALATAGVDDSLLEAAVYAVRNQDFGYLVRQYERLAGPVVEQAMADQARRAEGDAEEARSEAMQDARAFG